MQSLLKIIDIPANEKEIFEKLIKDIRKRVIRPPKDVVEKVFAENKSFLAELKAGNASTVIETARELAWQEFLQEESDFNTEVLKEITIRLKTPKTIVDFLIKRDIIGKSGGELVAAVESICGEYAGRVYPYIYALSLSNTNSRRSRSGSTFEAIMYKIYEYLEYPFDSQKKAGRKLFEDQGLGKKVDSILPSVEKFGHMRTKVIIGTMKTSLRERWQEVAEEIERTKVPQIHLLTVDTEISKSKAEEMSRHNIIIVALKSVANSESLKSMRNIISFEEYLFEEIPQTLAYWGKIKA